MKYSILALSLLACASAPIVAKQAMQSTTKSCCKKYTCQATPISGPTTILYSGCYCLTRDIKGTIIIDADNVTLDLNCHLVDGDGAPAAITVANHVDVTIKNGAVTNAGSLGISATDCAGVIVEDVQIYGSNNALSLTRLQSSQINTVKAYDNFNTAGAVILVDNCDSIQLTDVQANDNIKELTASAANNNPGIGIISVFNSVNITLIDCTTNSNSRTNNNCRFAPMVALFSQSVTFINCQSNNNVIPLDDTRAFTPFQALVCLDTVFDGVQANGNSVNSVRTFFRAIYIADAPRAIIRNAQVNNNSCQSITTPPPGFFADVSGIYIFQNAIGINDNIISSCQISGNTLADAGPEGFEGDLLGIVISAFSDFADFEGRSVIEDCQINDNIMTSTLVGKFVDGIVVQRTADITINAVSCNGNSGGEVTSGILVVGLPAFGALNPCRNITISNCTANDNSAQDQAIGILLEGGLSTASGQLSAIENCTIINCQANRNSAQTNGFGIAFENAIGCSVINCQTDANSRSGIYAGFVYPPNTPNNSNNSIINCSAKGNGLHGFELSSTGTNDNFLLKDNVALANGSVGFLHENDVLTSRYLGNYAKDNSTNYSINGGAIQLFSLDINGTYSHISGDVDHFSALVNIDGNGF